MAQRRHAPVKANDSTAAFAGQQNRQSLHEIKLRLHKLAVAFFTNAVTQQRSLPANSAITPGTNNFHVALLFCYSLFSLSTKNTSRLFG